MACIAHWCISITHRFAIQVSSIAPEWYRLPATGKIVTGCNGHDPEIRHHHLAGRKRSVVTVGNGSKVTVRKTQKRTIARKVQQASGCPLCGALATVYLPGHHLPDAQ